MSYDQIYKFRRLLTTTFCLLGFVVCAGMGVYGLAAGQAFARVACEAAALLLVVLVFSRYDDLKYSPFLMIVILTALLLHRSYSIRSAYNLALLTPVIVFSGILTNRWFTTAVFAAIAAFLGYGIHTGVYTISQTIDPETGIYLTNTVSVLIPLLALSYGISLLSSKFLVDTIHDLNQYNRDLQSARDALARSETELAAILDKTPDIILRMDRVGNITFINQAVERYGFAPASLIGKNVISIIHPDDLETARGRVFEHRGGEDSVRDLELRVMMPAPHPPGVYDDPARIELVFLVQVEVLYDAGGPGGRMRTGAQVMAHDVTEQVRLREEMKSVSEYNRVLFTDSKIPLGVFNIATYSFVDCNDAAARAYGYKSREELIGMSPLEVLAPDQSGGRSGREMIAEVGRQLRQGKSAILPCRHRRPDGTEWDSLVHLIAFNAGGRRLTQFSVTDVTELNRANEAIRESEERLRGFIDQTADAVSIVDEDGRVVEWNQASERMSNLPRAEVLGRYYWDVLFRLVVPERRTEEQRRFIEEKIREILQTGVSSFPGQSEFEIMPVGASAPLITRQTVFPIRTDRGFRFGTIAQDITRTRQMEREREHLETQLRQAQRLEAIGQLAGGVAHDLNNVLTPIMGYCDLLKLDLPPGRPERESVEEIQKASVRARDLIRQLLTFARRQPIEIKSLDLNQVLTGLQKMLRRTIREDIRIKYHLSAGDSRIMGDIGQVEQIIMNLAVNAQDAMPDGGAIIIGAEVVVVEPSAAREYQVEPGKYVLLSVADNGVGMAPEIIPNIFDPFFTTKEHGKGTGLGLATVYGIVKQHGGHVLVESEPGQGTRFRLFFPFAGVPDQVVEHEESTAVVGGDETILVVEDQPQVLGMVQAALERFGYQVHTAASAEAALDLFEKDFHRIRLLLTDVIMTGMNGPELHRRILQRRPDLPAVFMTGYAAEIIDGNKVGPLAHLLLKPFTFEALARKVREALDTTAAPESSISSSA